MSSLADYEAFVAIMEAGSLTAASRRLGRSLQSVSRALASLEDDVGASLIRRTTRSMQPTEAGRMFYRRIKAALADIGVAYAEAAERTGEVGGVLRIGASSLFGPRHVVPALAAYMSRFPAVEVELVLEDDYQDLMAAELDLAVRLGELEDNRMVARQVGAVRQVAFATSDYLRRHGRPSTPADLSEHHCIVRTHSRSPRRWTFMHAGELEVIPVSARFRSDSAAACNEAVAQSAGVGIAPLWQISDLVDEGQVELVLTEFELPPIPVHLVWPQASALPARTRTAIDFLAVRLTAELTALG